MLSRVRPAFASFPTRLQFRFCSVALTLNMGGRKRKMSDDPPKNPNPKKPWTLKLKPRREFEFERFPRRRIALQFYYLGWTYDGLVCQKDTDNTVEEHIMKSLEKTRLIESREIANWTRCGRTDKGVSAFRQVAGVTVRSNLAEGEGLEWHPDSDPFSRITGNDRVELNYVQMLNGTLPPTIRVMAWAPVNMDFNARYNCKERVYKYWFPLADMNLDLMRDGGQRLTGEHDFRNFCWIDKNKNRLDMQYLRKITDVSVAIVPNGFEGEGNSKYRLCELTVAGSGFLWHQIRCVVSVLTEIGRGNESPDIIDKLLDIEANPQRPQYNLANGTPLCLFDCSYGEVNPKWIWDMDIVMKVVNHLQMTWADLQAKSAMVLAMMSGIEGGAQEELRDNSSGFDDFIRNGTKTRVYVPFLNRPKCDSLETKREKVLKKEAEKEKERKLTEAQDLG